MNDRPTILLVDDEVHIRRSCKRILEKCDFNVLEAADGVQAEQIYAEDPLAIDLVIIDMIMPNRDGRRTLKELLRINPGVKALLFSGEISEEAVRHALRDGFKGHINKPCDAGRMLDIIRDALK